LLNFNRPASAGEESRAVHMKLAVLAAGDPLDVRTWSGTPYFMTKVLQEKFPDLFVVRLPRLPWFQFARRAARKATAGRIDLVWSHAIAKLDARRIARRMKAERIDVAFSIACSPISAYLAELVPTIHVSDATVPLMRDYYQEFAILPDRIANSARELDFMSVRRSRACLYPTEWAARSAVHDYQAETNRIFSIPWGANVDHQNEVPQIVPDDVCNLVFIGVDWERKGGQIAVDAVNQLTASGFPVKLHIVGAAPHLPPSDAIVVHGFIDKRSDEGRKKFQNLMRQAAFLFAPAIATKTGGVPDVVHEGVNSHLLPIDATAAQYADLIWSIWSDRSRYERLRQTSRKKFDSSLNWNSWLSAVIPIIEHAAS
jgi:glycosyltransferase involved in cell wall biosynthesis